MASIKESLSKIMTLDGIMGTCIVDFESGMLISKEGSGVDFELAAAGNSEVIKAKMKTMKSLGLKGGIEDILITLENQYHILRPTVSQKGMFIYLVLNKSKSNLALARRKVLEVEEELTV